MIDTDIATHIRNQIAELDAERETLTNALAALENGAGGRADPKPAARPRARTRDSVKAAAPAAAVVPLGKILQLLTRTDGQTTSALAKTTGGDQSRILEMLKQAEADDKVTRTGQRRATRWHIVTDRPKAAGRVAESSGSPDPAAVEKRRAARRKSAANRRVKAAKAAAATTARTPDAA